MNKSIKVRWRNAPSVRKETGEPQGGYASATEHTMHVTRKLTISNQSKRRAGKSRKAEPSARSDQP